MRDHPSQEQLELYVLDALSEGESLTVEIHVSECEACARRLAREASLELAFGLVAQGGFASSAARCEARAAASSPARGRGLEPEASHARAARMRRVAGGLGAACAMAMCALLWLGRAKADDRAPDPQLTSAHDAEGYAPASVDRLDGG
jgi:anti-sigma factor RsiW